MTIPFYQATGGPVPKFEVEINLTSAGSAPSTDTFRNIYIMAERVAAGTSVADTISPAFGSADAGIAWFGANSPGAVMAAQIFYHREPTVGLRKGKIFGCALAAAAGVVATNTLTFATTASGSGTWIFSVGGHQFSVSVASGDTAIVQATAFCAAYDALPAHQRMPLTVDNGAGTLAVVTLTGSVACAGLNTIGCSTIQDPDVTTTDTWAATTLTGGTLYPDTATLLAAMLSTQAPLIAVPWDLDGWKTEAEDVVTHINLVSDGTHMLGATVICADVDSASNLVSDADGLDDDDGERVMVVGMKAGEYWAGELAAKVAAIQAAEPHIARSLNGLALQDVQIPTDANNWTADEMKTMLQGGVVPLYVPAGDDQLRICRAVSIRTEYGVMDFAIMPTLDYVRSDLRVNGSQAFSRASIVGDDDELPDVPHVVQPKLILAWAKNRCLMHQRNGYLQAVEANWVNAEIEWDGANTVTMALPTSMVPQLHNTMIRMDQVIG